MYVLILASLRPCTHPSTLGLALSLRSYTPYLQESFSLSEDILELCQHALDPGEVVLDLPRGVLDVRVSAEIGARLQKGIHLRRALAQIIVHRLESNEQGRVK